MALLPPNVAWIVEDFVFDAGIYDPEDGPVLRALGRAAIATGHSVLLARVKGAFLDLWARRDALELEEFLWSAGNSPASPGWNRDGYWSDGEIGTDDEWRWDY